MKKLAYGKLHKIAINNVAGTNTHRASPYNVHICLLAIVLNDSDRTVVNIYE